MLSAFTARPIIELKQRDKSKIECILAQGDRVFVGLNTGSLRVYRVNEPASPPNGTTTCSAPESHPEPPPQTTTTPKPTDLLREVEKFSPRAIEQLAIIKEANIIVSLSNYAVSLHDWQTFEPVEAPLPRTKNASVFAVTSNIVKDSDTGIPEIISRLAVAVKRRLLLWSWHESELGPDVGEIVLAEAIRSVTWASATKVVCGMNGGYVLVDVVTHAVEDIVGPGAIGGPGNGQGSRFGAVSSAGMGYMGLGGYIPRPLAAKLADGEMLLAKDINSLFIDDTGKALEKRQVPWAAAPEDIGYSYPYILALQPPSKGSLEVRNPDTLNLLQTIPLAGAAALHFPPPTSSLAHAGKGFHVLSDRVVWKMGATDYDSQVDELIQSGKYDEAISVLGMLEDALLKNKTETLREVKMRKAEVLFGHKKYRDSMDLFNEEDVYAPPERVLKLFPRVISGELSGIPEEIDEEKVEDHNENGSTNGDKATTTDTPAPQSSSSPQKGGGIAKYLMGGGHRRPANLETASLFSKKGDADDSDTSSIKGKPATEDKSLEDKDTQAAVSELFSYLAGARVRLQRVINPETGKLKPRKSQSGATEDAFKTLLSSSQDESDDQLEASIKQTFKLIDTTLFRAYMYARPTLIGSLLRVPNFCDPEVVNEKLLEHNRYNELVDFFYGKRLHAQALWLLRRFGEPDQPDPAAPGLHGPGNTVQYLLKLPAEMIDLLLEYSEWTLRQDPELGMEVFLADSENAETLPRERVMRFLSGIELGLEVRYLEHVIGELGDLTPEFHNRLVEVLVRILREKKDKTGEEFEGLMERLVRFLRETDEYGKLRAFNLIPRDDVAFYEAQAVVLCKMEQHKQALELYVFKMKDYDKAEDYCNRIHKTQEPPPTTAAPSDEDPNPQPSIYHTLLSLYLTPSPPHAPNLAPALSLLSRHGSRLPAESTLDLIPNDLPITQLASYFRGRMRNTNSVVNETRIVAGLRKTELVTAQASLLLSSDKGGRNRRVVIGDERVCGVCHKRLGGRSVVAVLPDSSVVHYGCLGRVGGAGGGKGSEGVGVGAWGRRVSGGG